MSHKFIFFVLVFCIALIFQAMVPFVTAQDRPYADAGSNLYLDSGDTVTIDARAKDLNGEDLTYFWDCTAGKLSSSHIEDPKYTAPSVDGFDKREIKICTFTVKNKSGYSASDSIKIYLNYDKDDIQEINVKTRPVSNINNNTATLNGYFETVNTNIKYAWFEYGFSKNYKNKTSKQEISGQNSNFSQEVGQLFLNGEYHYRAAVQDANGNFFYGQDMIFTANSNSHQIDGEENQNFSIAKKILNLTTGQSIWSESVAAKPGDILCIAITVTAKENLTNVNLKETLPATLSYIGDLQVNSIKNYYDNPISGINIGSIAKGNSATVSYQAKIAQSQSFNYGLTAISTTTTVSNDQQKENYNNGAIFISVLVNNTDVQGASTILGNPTDTPTGLTNNLFRDSFLLPLLVIILGLWLHSWIKIKSNSIDKINNK